MQMRLYASFRELAGVREAEIPAEPGETVGAVLRRVVELYPGLKGELLTSDGQELLPLVQVLISGRSVRDLQGLETRIKPGDELILFPPIAGG